MPEQMTTLKEIKERANNTLYIKELFELDSYLNGQDVSLLIRAVGQLWAALLQTGDPITLMQVIDPDVLALREDNDA